MLGVLARGVLGLLTRTFDFRTGETLNHLLYLRKSEVGSAIQACRRLVQQLKVDGLPGGEAHRLDQYLSIIACHFHQVAMLKEYRTPVGTSA